MSTVTIIHNAVNAQLVEPVEEVRCLVQDYLSYEVQGAEHMGKGAGWDGRSSLFQRKKNRFPAGFVSLVKNRLRKNGYKVKIKRNQIVEPKGPENPVVDDFGFVERYDYQVEVPSRLVELRMMIAQIATGGGKSRIFKLCAKRLGLPTLFITNRKSLMYQMAQGYEDSFPDEPYGVIGDGTWNPNPEGVTFAIVDTLVSRLEVYDYKKLVTAMVDKHMEKVEIKIETVLKAKKLPFKDSDINLCKPDLKAKIKSIKERVMDRYPADAAGIDKSVKEKIERQVKKRESAISFLKQIQFVTLEEAHDVSGFGYFHILNQCVNADYRLSLTATPFMKASEEANMRLMAVSGSIGIRVSEKKLIDRGILAKPYFKYVALPKPPKLYRSTPWQKAYKIGIVENEYRNDQIVRYCLEMKKRGLTVLVLVQQTKHGDILKKLLIDEGVKTEFIRGNDKQDRRQESLNKLGKNEIDVLIGTTILDVGVDAPAVGMVILAGGGKAEVALRQRVGRGLREKKKGQNVCFVVDFQDGHNNHLQDHFFERKTIIEGTPGFSEGIVDKFDYDKILKVTL